MSGDEPLRYALSFIIIGLIAFMVPLQTHAQFEPVKLHDLRGMVDTEGTTHLFYRIKKLEIPNEEYPQEDENHFYHLNTETGRDTLFLRDERDAVFAGEYGYNAETRRVVDFVFPDNDPASYVFSFNICSFECSGYVMTDDSVNLGYGLGTVGKLTLAPNREMLYFYQDGVWQQGTLIFRYSEGNWKRVSEATDTVDLKYRLLSFHPYRDSLAFGTYQKQLIRTNAGTQYEVVIDSLKWWEKNLDFHYSKDSSVVLFKSGNRYYGSGKSRLYRSDDYGKEGAWTIIAEDSTYFAVETDRRQGRVFMSEGNRLMFSNDGGDTFTKGPSFQYPITGIYKPDKATNTLYVSTLTDIWRLEAGVKVESLKHVQVNIKDQDPSLPSKYSLKQNYPNPFNPNTTIEYSLPEATDVTLRVYNMIGKKVATLVDEKQQSGRHRVSFDASQLSSGVYLYRIDTNNFTQSRKMMLLK